MEKFKTGERLGSAAIQLSLSRLDTLENRVIILVPIILSIYEVPDADTLELHYISAISSNIPQAYYGPLISRANLTKSSHT